MDVDWFVARHGAEWDRLAELARRAGRFGGGLGPGELEELLRGYDRATLHLSQARTRYRDPATIRRISTAVAAAHAAIHGARQPRLAALRRFLAWTFPAAVWTCRRQLAAAAVVFLGVAVVVGVLFWRAPDRIDLVIPESYQEIYVEEEFVQYYSEDPSAAFFSRVTTNNIQVSVLAFALGATLVLPGAYILFTNGAAIGSVAGLFATTGGFWDPFLVSILPHGLLELTCIVVSGGAGIRVGWAIFSPGDRSRPEALGDEGRRSVVILLGTALAFVAAGLIEGFVTGSPALPDPVKIGIGVIAWAGFLAWVLGRGRLAVADGYTGSLEELRPSRPRITALVEAPVGTQRRRGFSEDPLGDDPRAEARAESRA